MRPALFALSPTYATALALSYICPYQQDCEAIIPCRTDTLAEFPTTVSAPAGTSGLTWHIFNPTHLPLAPPAYESSRKAWQIIRPTSSSQVHSSTHSHAPPTTPHKPPPDYASSRTRTPIFIATEVLSASSCSSSDATSCAHPTLLPHPIPSPALGAEPENKLRTMKHAGPIAALWVVLSLGVAAFLGWLGWILWRDWRDMRWRMRGMKDRLLLGHGRMR
jgi:hypothetical protein